ncbi:putative phosphosugar isomerase [Belliella baltica DSM 15883]|uniref:Putative phosphosugar isomerase n=1 Tax=Belliella baltica (strain DSM 15883 / CIP 108006 / LMG 21964 / BA134) TaxID=866536 RepID=I3Z956_BELBD|nr:SIS domain-containing protein [Belliella baltica]AFL85774.1 putative phosphosugar isomerase [Belliella baltica DSM 15883]
MILTTYLNLEKQSAVNAGAENTAREIVQQPRLWLDVLALIASQKNDLAAFLYPLIEKPDLRIILTGAGSSAFIGESAQGIVQRNTGRLTQAIATTDIVTHPELTFQKQTPTLMVSFARSGNSPESVETVLLADENVSEIYHLIITCNEEGQLAGYAKRNKKRSYCLQLPENANDKSLAMTGSFTSMLLSVLLVSNLAKLSEIGEQVLSVSEIADAIIAEHLDDFISLSSKNFERVIFLGSGPMLGIARECHLKLQELTDGKVICKHDSFLGFRHGPRAVLNEKSLIVFLFSSESHVYQYERDLAISIADDLRKIPIISFGGWYEDDFRPLINIAPRSENCPAGDFRMLTGTLIGQLMGFYKSLELGLQPDNPSVSGAISRVVQGVKIYKKV